MPFEQKEYVELLSKKSDAQLKVLWQRSQTGLPKMESYGGLSSDQISKTTPDRTGRLAPLEQAFEGGMNVFTFDKSFDRKRMIDSLSTRLAIADHLKSTSVGQMVKDVALFKTNSPIVKLICSTYGIIPDLSSNTACIKVSPK